MERTGGPIVELRRYILHPGARETLIELFDREFVETQEETGMRVLGQFRDLDDPDSFVWLRGFADMETRQRALEAFYSGPAWRAHASAANATMVDCDNVLLLRQLSGVELDGDDRPPPGSTPAQPGVLVVTIYPLQKGASQGFPEFFDREVEPCVRAAGISMLATYATEHADNTFPALPVRDGADVFLWLAMFANEAEHGRRLAALEEAPDWGRISHALARQLDERVEVLRLTPTGRSLLHG